MIKSLILAILLIPALYIGANGQEPIRMVRPYENRIRIVEHKYHRPYTVNPSKMSFEMRYNLARQGVYVPRYGDWHTRHTIYNHKVIYPRVHKPYRTSY